MHYCQSPPRRFLRNLTLKSQSFMIYELTAYHLITYYSKLLLNFESIITKLRNYLRHITHLSKFVTSVTDCCSFSWFLLSTGEIPNLLPFLFFVTGSNLLKKKKKGCKGIIFERNFRNIAGIAGFSPPSSANPSLYIYIMY